MKISVIVPCRNEKAHIRPFLDSVMLQQLDPGDQLEILVADGLSDDGTAELLHAAQRSLPLRVIDNPQRIVSTGLNAAIEASTGEVIVRMDVHTVYAPDYIRQCVQLLRETGADSAGGPWVAQGRGAIGRAISAAFHSRFCSGGGKSHQPDYEGEVDTVYLGSWPRSTFEKVGLFDPDLVRNQDDEFHFRLTKTGGRILQSPRIRSVYTPRNSFKALFRQYMQYGFWKVAVFRKHGELAAWRHTIPGLFVASILVSCILAGIFGFFGLPKLAAAVAWMLFGELAAYACLTLLAAFAARRTEPLSVLTLIPIVIGTYHIAYGTGFLAGLFSFYGPSRSSHPSRAFTTLSR